MNIFSVHPEFRKISKFLLAKFPKKPTRMWNVPPVMHVLHFAIVFFGFLP